MKWNRARSDPGRAAVRRRNGKKQDRQPRKGDIAKRLSPGDKGAREVGLFIALCRGRSFASRQVRGIDARRRFHGGTIVSATKRTNLRPSTCKRILRLLVDKGKRKRSVKLVNKTLVTSLFSMCLETAIIWQRITFLFGSILAEIRIVLRMCQMIFKNGIIKKQTRVNVSLVQNRG